MNKKLFGFIMSFITMMFVMYLGGAIIQMSFDLAEWHQDARAIWITMGGVISLFGSAFVTAEYL